MSEFNIEVEGGNTVKLPTAGKYCDRDIIVTATSGGGSGGDYQQGFDAGYEYGHAQGYSQGYAEGSESGYQSGLSEGEALGYTAGQTAEYDRFWEAYQRNGTRRNYYRAFVEDGWTDENFNPKYTITCEGSGTQGQYVFDYCDAITRIPVDIVINNTPANYIFNRCTSLVTIKKLVLNGVPSLTNSFTRCDALENLTIEGSIDVNLNISATAVLSDASVQSIIDHLADLTGATAQKLTLHNTVGSKLTEAQKAAITAKNWTLTY